jgi:TRAP-type C4-dicarboxylate transport system permease small subunit
MISLFVMPLMLLVVFANSFYRYAVQTANPSGLETSGNGW